MICYVEMVTRGFGGVGLLFGFFVCFGGVLCGLLLIGGVWDVDYFVEFIVYIYIGGKYAPLVWDCFWWVWVVELQLWVWVGNCVVTRWIFWVLLCCVDGRCVL